MLSDDDFLQLDPMFAYIQNEEIREIYRRIKTAIMTKGL